MNWFEALPERQQQPTQALARVLKALNAADPTSINASLRSFLAAAAPSGTSVAQLQQVRGLLTWACEHLARELGAMAVNPEPVNQARENAIQLIMGAPSTFAMTDAFRAFVEQLRQYVMQLYSQREQKIVSETHRIAREFGPDKVTIQDIAGNLKLSAGHLGRVYSRTTGQTLEEYLIRQKLEMGKRLLLDPRMHVSEVSDRCGFCNPAYFASVFKKYMHCTPRALRKPAASVGQFRLLRRRNTGCIRIEREENACVGLYRSETGDDGRPCSSHSTGDEVEIAVAAAGICGVGDAPGFLGHSRRRIRPWCWATNW